MKPYKSGTEWFLIACLSPAKLLYVNYTQSKLIRTFQLREGVFPEAWDVSSDQGKLVVGYWDARGIDAWDLNSGEQLCHMGPAKISQVAIDASGRFVAVRSDERSALLDLKRGTDEELPYAGELCGACICRRDETLLLPTDRNGLIYRLHSRTGHLESVNLPGHSVIWRMRWSANESQLLILESNGRVSCQRDLASSPEWDYMLSAKEKTSTASFSGDGRHIALNIPESGKTIVLDSANGCVQLVLDTVVGGVNPLDGPFVMTHSGFLVNLEDGTVLDGASDWKWWRAIGV